MTPGCLVSPVTYTNGEPRHAGLADDEGGQVVRYLPARCVALVLARSARSPALVLVLGSDMCLGWAAASDLYPWTGRRG